MPGKTLNLTIELTLANLPTEDVHSLKLHYKHRDTARQEDGQQQALPADGFFLWANPGVFQRGHGTTFQRNGSTFTIQTDLISLAVTGGDYVQQSLRPGRYRLTCLEVGFQREIDHILWSGTDIPEDSGAIVVPDLETRKVALIGIKVEPPIIGSIT